MKVSNEMHAGSGCDANQLVTAAMVEMTRYAQGGCRRAATAVSASLEALADLPALDGSHLARLADDLRAVWYDLSRTPAANPRLAAPPDARLVALHGCSCANE